MAEVIPFPRKSQLPDDDSGIDLLTAVDAAIRDLREISRRWGEASALRQAEECRNMLERAYDDALSQA